MVEDAPLLRESAFMLMSLILLSKFMMLLLNGSFLGSLTEFAPENPNHIPVIPRPNTRAQAWRIALAL